MKHTSSIYLVFLLLLQSGCVYVVDAALGPEKAYEGQERSINDLAILKEQSCRIKRINEQELDLVRSRELHLLPGKKHLIVAYSENYSNAAWTTQAWSTHHLTFQAQAGHTYNIVGGAFVMGRHHCVYVEDEATRKKLAASASWCSR